ncbi:hypothetical protein ACFQ6S_42065 [Streptomyces sp. NPDC056479]|uniref:hypothetical protein n=1 Tax=Streptomyces sp. NPDC056479 TaxID=3345832 RepID=UPI0036A41A57
MLRWLTRRPAQHLRLIRTTTVQRFTAAINLASLTGGLITLTHGLPAEKELIPAGTVAFLGPADEVADYLTWIHAIAPSNATPCDGDLIRDVDQILALPDNHSPQVERLKSELDVLEQRLNGNR